MTDANKSGGKPFEESISIKKRISVLAMATINPFLKRSKRVFKEVKVKVASSSISFTE